MDWGEAGVRIFVSGITLLAVCSSLLGVVLGWRLRGREVEVLRRNVRYFKEQLNKYSADRRIEYKVAECREEHPTLKGVYCTRPEGHNLPVGPSEGGLRVRTKHGYAGMFWGEGSR